MISIYLIHILMNHNQ